MDFNRAELTCYRTNFSSPVPAKKIDRAFSYVVLRVMCLTKTRGLIQFSNCAGLSRFNKSRMWKGLHMMDLCM